MKKVLLGTTGLIAAGAIAGAAMVATPAAAQMQGAVSTGGALDVSITGRNDFNYRYTDSDLLSGTATRNDSQFQSDFRFSLNADGVGDATGIRYGYRSRLRTSSTAGAGGNVVFDRNWVFFRGGFGEVRLGNEVPVVDNLRIVGGTFSAKGTGGIDGFSQLAPGNLVPNSGNSNKIVYYTPNIMGFQAGFDYATKDGSVGRASNVATTQQSDPWSVAANWRGDLAGVDLGVHAGYSSSGSASGLDGRRDYQLGGSIGFMGFVVDGGYHGVRSSANAAGLVEAITAGIGTEIGGVGLSFTFRNSNVKFGDATQFYYISAGTPILPGVSILGDLGYVDGANDGIDAVIQLRTVF